MVVWLPRRWIEAGGTSPGIPHQYGKRRLTDAAGFGGAAEMLEFGHRRQVPKVLDVHVSSRAIIIDDIYRIH